MKLQVSYQVFFLVSDSRLMGLGEDGDNILNLNNLVLIITLCYPMVYMWRELIQSQFANSDGTGIIFLD